MPQVKKAPGRPKGETKKINLEAAKKRNEAHARHTQRAQAAARDIGDIPAVKHPKIKARFAKLTPKAAMGFCHHYLPDDFSDPFTPDQIELITDLIYAIKHGTWWADAMPRGDGKSTIAEGVMTWAVCYGFLRFPVIVTATTQDSKNRIDDLKRFFEQSDRLYEDFPEICHPVRSLEGSSRKAGMQTCNGELTHIEWGGEKLAFPIIPGSKAAGACIMCKTIEGAIRGLKHGPLRPDFVFLDDIETDETAYSLADTDKRRRKIEKGIVGLAGKKKAISIFMACTIIKKECLADEFTDPKRKPAWHGKRYKMLATLPVNVAMWEKYIELRQTDQLAGDDTGRTAHAYYLENREKMDEGHVVSNPYRFNKNLEVSALQACYNLIADMDWDNFSAEYQNDPPNELGIETVGINIAAVCKKTINVPRGTIPEWCEVLTRGVDVHGRILHWVDVAWKQGMQGHIVDYGTETVHTRDINNLTADENKTAVEAAIVSALEVLADWEAENGYPMESTGETVHVNLGLIDAGWMPNAVGQFIQANASGRYRASMGFGSTQKKRYAAPRGKSTAIRNVGVDWHAVKSVAVGGLLWQFNADNFKNAVHRGFMTTDGPGSLALYQDDPIKHRDFGKHICAEIWKKEHVSGPGGGYKEYFDVKDRNNHKLDCMAQAMAAASMCGIRLLGDVKKVHRRRIGKVNR
jgi:hypothetical protein